MTGLTSVSNVAVPPAPASNELRRRVVREVATILRVPPGAISDKTLLTGAVIDDLERAMESPMQLQFGMQGLTVAQIVEQYASRTKP